MFYLMCMFSLFSYQLYFSVIRFICWATPEILYFWLYLCLYFLRWVILMCMFSLLGCRQGISSEPRQRADDEGHGDPGGVPCDVLARREQGHRDQEEREIKRGGAPERGMDAAVWPGTLHHAQRHYHGGQTSADHGRTGGRTPLPAGQGGLCQKRNHGITEKLHCKYRSNMISSDRTLT